MKSIQWATERRDEDIDALPGVAGREDLKALFGLLQQIKPLMAGRFPLAQARQARELLGKGGVTGKFVLVARDSALEIGAS